MSANVEMSTPSRYPENLSHHNAFTSPSQFLVPFSVYETLPGDSFEVDPAAVVELMPFNSLFFGDIKANFDTFFVSTRTIYGDEFMKWFMLRKLQIPTVSIRDTVPGANPVTISIDNQYWKLLDMLGYPIGMQSGAGTNDPQYVNPTKFFGYFKIVRDYYLDPTLDQELIGKIDNQLSLLTLEVACQRMNVRKSDIDENLDTLQASMNTYAESAFGALFRLFGQYDAVNNPVSCLVQRRLKRDYFTSLLPNLQFGEPMRIPIEGPFVNDDTSSNTPHRLYATGSEGSIKADPTASGEFDPYAGPVYVIPGTIRDLQRIEDVQRFLERLNFAGGDGAHPKDLYEAIYGESPDSITLGRSVWIDSFDRDVLMSEVVQTAPASGDDNFLGSKAANGQIAAKGSKYSVFTKEHGYIMHMFSLMPRVFYAYCPRDTFKHDFADFYLPDLAMIGEQEVLGRELISQVDMTDQSDADGEFYSEKLVGYQPRYEEYRRRPNELHGGFRTSEAAQMIHGRVFDGQVNLNEDFIQYPNDGFNQIFAYINPQADTCFVHMIMEIHAVRPVIDNPTRV